MRRVLFKGVHFFKERENIDVQSAFEVERSTTREQDMNCCSVAHQKAPLHLNGVIGSESKRIN